MHPLVRHGVILAALAFVLATSPAYAGENINVGDKIPAFESVHDQDGNAQNFESLKGVKGLALVFVRSLVWCAYCQHQVASLDSYLSDFQNAGYHIAAVSNDSQRAVGTFAKHHHIHIRLLSDPTSTLIRDFGLLDLSQAEGSIGAGTAQPTIYVINQNGVVTSRLDEGDYMHLPGIEDVLAALK